MAIGEIAQTVLGIQSPFVTRVAIDGVDGAGKTVFADELARRLEAFGAKVIRASVDGFHHPRSVRYRRGRYCPKGFHHDSYDYQALEQALLEPLSPGGSGQFIPAVFDHRTDTPVRMSPRQASAGDILVFDGIFAHRRELRGYWDLSVFLEVPFETSVRRLGWRDGTSPDPDAPLNRRYIEGQLLYLSECSPADRATVVVDNSELGSPRILRYG
ncbi:hypothetical protein MLC59_05385 [Marinobacter bryozoorum]|uniref:hypothetical protein n=1 Tax=Marinobacter bryozoorum TaxID=256324 RepID=UPI0020030144|nr:hypothetical protein [Marinobacter bryozoorum]MCK7543597.1 hypothetical protein [Marinobacter bryozoorum]